MIPVLTTPAYLRVDDFLRTELEARALALALERGLVDRLAAGPLPAEAAATLCAVTPAGGRMLLDLLRTNAVVSGRGDSGPGDSGQGDSGEGDLALTPAFRAVLPFRDLLEAKLGFAALAAADVQDHLGPFLGDLEGFMARAGTFALFRYDLCRDAAPAGVAAARRWMAYTTALTRHEAGPLWDAIGIGGHHRLLDVGGNSGEFARHACRRSPGLAATVFDLPAVCAVGRDHLSGTDDGRRVRFVPGDLRRDALPAGHDLVTVKSVLHDWPDADARAHLAKACAALAPGGRLVVVERAPFRITSAPTYAAMTNLVFLPFLRAPDLYREVMEAQGLRDVAVSSVALETPFQIVSGRAP